MAKSTEQRAAKAIAKEAIRISGLDERAFSALPEDEKQKFIEQAKGEPDMDHKIAQESEEDEAEVDNSHLITMIKSGEDSLDVHPTCVKAHEDAGWKVK